MSVLGIWAVGGSTLRTLLGRPEWYGFPPVERIHSGQTAIDVDIVGRLVRHQRTSGAPESLTAREQDVLPHIASALSWLRAGRSVKRPLPS